MTWKTKVRGPYLFVLFPCSAVKSQLGFVDPTEFVSHRKESDSTQLGQLRRNRRVRSRSASCSHGAAFVAEIRRL